MVAINGVNIRLRVDEYLLPVHDLVMSDNDQPDPEKKELKSDADVEQDKKAQENAPPPPLDDIIREAPSPRATDE